LLCEAAQQGLFWSAVRALAEGAPPNFESAARKLSGRLKPDGYTAFESDYITCFGHTVRGDCPMNEIEYGDIKADPLFQPHRLADLGAFYAAFGLEIGQDAAERQDHISIELEFMSVLAAKEAYALEHQFDDAQLLLVRDAQKKFLCEHLGRWTPAFTRRLSRMAGDGALGALADFTREFISADCVRLNVTPGSEDLLLRPIDDSLETLCASCGITSLPPGAITAPVES
jgi:DMSO reductase family type II enzyme chaperone